MYSFTDVKMLEYFYFNKYNSLIVFFLKNKAGALNFSYDLRLTTKTELSHHICGN